ncbi:MAG: hypothetical protein U9Q74_08750, partial [Gemmatimonadota bacterium]|nr:hypothetical protein [Gemmatimonadota bacterium]
MTPRLRLFVALFATAAGAAAAQRVDAQQAAAPQASARPTAAQQAGASAPVTAIRAGRLIDPGTGTVATNQVILVQNSRFTAIGPNVAIPAGAQVIDLSNQTVLPGLVDAHNHLALTYKEDPERNIYYLT